MQNIESIVKEFGIEIPDDKKDAFLSKVSENYVTKAEHDKKLARSTADAADWKQKAEDAGAALKKFEGMDPDKIKGEIADWKKKAEDAETEYKRKIEERDFNDALTSELDKIQFTSNAAKESIKASVKSAGLSLKNGKIIGLGDLIEELKKEDAGAFADDGQKRAEGNAGKFTKPFGKNTGTKMTKEDFKKLSIEERIALKKDDPDLYDNLHK